MDDSSQLESISGPDEAGGGRRASFGQAEHNGRYHSRAEILLRGPIWVLDMSRDQAGGALARALITSARQL